MKPHSTFFWILIVFAAVLFCGMWKLDESPLAGTEGHRAIPAHTMAESGDWLLPQIYGKLYLRKPPLQYWAIALAEKATGLSSEWIWRVPSVLSAALLGAFLCAVSAHWFGPVAGPVGGFAYLALIALWSQHRSADVDALHTLAAVAAACGFIELNFGRGRRRGGWTLLTGVAFGAALLTKGPACLPPILGALAGASVCNRSWAWLKRPAPWFAIALGAGLFSLWAFAALRAVAAARLAPDLSGVEEAVGRLWISSLGSFLKALALPVLLLVYSLPVSFGLLLALHSAVIRLGDPFRGRRVRAVVGAFVFSLLLGVLSGMTNPRYGYVTLPLLGPVAGALAAAWPEPSFPDSFRRAIRSLLAFSTILLALALAVLTVRVWMSTELSAGLALTAVVAGLLCFAVLVAWALQDTGRLAGLFAVMLLLLVFPFSEFNNFRRTQRSGLEAGRALRKIVGDGSRVGACNMVWFQPEIFHYAGVDVDYFASPAAARPGWLVLHWLESRQWQTNRPGALTRIAPLPTRELGVEVAWYPPPPAEGKP